MTALVDDDANEDELLLMEVISDKVAQIYWRTSTNFKLVITTTVTPLNKSKISIDSPKNIKMHNAKLKIY
jgi:hypothetical protein